MLAVIPMKRLLNVLAKGDSKLPYKRKYKIYLLLLKFNIEI